MHYCIHGFCLRRFGEDVACTSRHSSKDDSNKYPMSFTETIVPGAFLSLSLHPSAAVQCRNESGTAIARNSWTKSPPVVKPSIGRFEYCDVTTTDKLPEYPAHRNWHFLFDEQEMSSSHFPFLEPSWLSLSEMIYTSWFRHRQSFLLLESLSDTALLTSPFLFLRYVHYIYPKCSHRYLFGSCATSIAEKPERHY